MRIFASTLTIYTYKEEDPRKKLNREEVEKFLEGMDFAGEFDRGVVFSDYTLEEIEKIAGTLSSEEKELFASLLTKMKNFKHVKVNLTDYEASYRNMKSMIGDLVSSHIHREDVSLKLNLSCGHKIGSLALYLATMHVVHMKEHYSHLSVRKDTKLSVDAYHTEKGIIEKLPTMNFESETNREWENLLTYLKTPKSLEDFKKEIKEDQDKALMYLKKHRYIEMKGNMLHLTKRGKMLVYLLEKIS